MGSTKRLVDLMLSSDKQVDHAWVAPALNEWIVATGPTTNAIAAATKAAVANKAHVIAGVLVSLNAAGNANFTVSDGTNTVVQHVYDKAGWIPLNLRATANKTVAVSIAAAGAGVAGLAAIVGFTISE